jgi:replicative DNA helicase
MNIKQLPTAENAEKALLWAMLIDEDIINLIDLKQRDFYNTTFWKIYNLMKKIKSHGKTVDLVVIKEYLDNKNILTNIWWITFLVDLVENTPSSLNWKNYRDLIKEKSDRRKIIKYASEIQEMWYREDETMKDILNNIENVSEHIFNIREKDIKWDYEDFINSFEAMREKSILRDWMLWIPTLYKQVDKYTKWFIEWKIYTLVAYSNVWKSKISYTYLADFLKQWKRVMYISLEVDKGMLFSNLLATYYNKHYSN